MILLNGDFMNARKDQDFQVIPTDWIRAAMERWKERPYPPEGVPMCNMGVDIAAGGDDNTVLCMRYDYWFSELVKVAGKDTPLGRDVAGHVFKHRKDNAKITPDMSGGFGSGLYECLVDNIGRDAIKSYKGGESTAKRTRDRQYGFFNLRSAAYWMLREALDPDQVGGSPIMLPPDRLLLSDLSAATFEITSRGIQITPKKKLIEKLGRSTDCGDAVVMANWNGLSGLNPAKQIHRKSFSAQSLNKMPKTANMGYSNRRRKF